MRRLSEHTSLAVLMAVTACRATCEQPHLNEDVSEVKPALPPHLQRVPIPPYLQFSIFPPRWMQDQRWLVKYRQVNRYGLYTTQDPPVTFLLFTTAIGFDAMSIDSYAHEPLDPASRNRRTFGLHPFGLHESWSVDKWGRATNRWFVGDRGPCCALCRCGMEVPSEAYLDPAIGFLEAQTSEPMENGIRFYFGADKAHPRVIEWLSGEPWWSRLYVLGQPEREMPGLGTDCARLVRMPDGTPMSPPPLPDPAEPPPDAGAEDSPR